MRAGAAQNHLDPLRVETGEIRFRWDVEDSPNIEQVGCVFDVQFDVLGGTVGVQIEVLKGMKMDIFG